MYAHELTISFFLKSNDPGGEDLTLDQVRKAVARRLGQLTLISQKGSDQWKNAVLPPVRTQTDWLDGAQQIVVEILPSQGRRRILWWRKS